MRSFAAVGALALAGLVSATLNTPSNRCEGTLTVTNGCAGYVQIKAGDTCASILAGAGKMSLSAFMGANPKVDCRRLVAQVGKKVCVKLPTKIHPGAKPFSPHNGCTKLRKITAAESTCAGVALAINDQAYSARTFAQLNGGLSVATCASLEIGTWYCSCDGSSLSHQPPATCRPRPCRWGSQAGYQCEHNASPCSSSGRPIAWTPSGWHHFDGHHSSPCDSFGRPITQVPGGFVNHQGKRCDRFGNVSGHLSFGGGLGQLLGGGFSLNFGGHGSSHGHH